MRLRESIFSRRGFVTGFIYGGLATIIAYVANPVIRFLFHKEEIPLPKAVTISQSDIDKISQNSARYFKYGHLPGILLKTEDGEIRAFSAKCTHLECTVQYKPESKKFFCACHEGFFSDNGANIAGPPPAPLTAFSIRKEGDMVVVSYTGNEKEKV